MFARERRDSIVEMINRNGQVRVKHLSERFNVTEDCIRKDLGMPEREGRLSRCYGGAVQVRIDPQAFNVVQRLDKNREIKHTIAAKSLSLIHEGDTVFLVEATAPVERVRQRNWGRVLTPF